MHKSDENYWLSWWLLTPVWAPLSVCLVGCFCAGRGGEVVVTGGGSLILYLTLCVRLCLTLCLTLNLTLFITFCLTLCAQAEVVRW